MLLRLLKIVVLLAVVMFGWVLHRHNGQAVTLDYLLGQISLPLSLIIAASVFLGALLAMLTALLPWLSLKRKQWQLQRQVRQLSAAHHTTPASGSPSTQPSAHG